MKIQILLVPYDSGQHSVRMGRGPDSFLRNGAGSRLRALGHPVDAEFVETDDASPTEIATTFALHARLAERVRAAVDTGKLPLVLSGNCGSALGTLAGLGASDVGVVWFDAHADFNTPETTTSGFLDGMALSTLVGRCWRPLAARVPGFRPIPEADVALVGTREMDPAEEELLNGSAIARVSAARIGRVGVRDALEPVLVALKRRVSCVYLHLDLDVLDPAHGRANHLAPPGGLTPGQLLEAITLTRAHFAVVAVGVASYDPECDEAGTVWHTTVQALELLVQGV